MIDRSHKCHSIRRKMRESRSVLFYYSCAMSRSILTCLLLRIAYRSGRSCYPNEMLPLFEHRRTCRTFPRLNGNSTQPLSVPLFLLSSVKMDVLPSLLVILFSIWLFSKHTPLFPQADAQSLVINPTDCANL